MSYIESVIIKHREKMNNVPNNIKRDFLFPDRKNPVKNLSKGETLILKMTFQLRCAFLEQFYYIFAYAYSKQNFQKMIQGLEEQGYIQSKTSKDFGKYWILTNYALFYIYFKSEDEFSNVRITEDSFPNESRLIYLKCLNGYYSNQVFKAFTDSVFAEYRNENKDFCRNYGKEQYIKQYIFPQAATNYSKKACDDFTADYISLFNNDKEQLENHKKFVKAIKDNADAEYVDNTLLRFAFIKDYFNEKHTDKEETLMKIEELFNAFLNNVYRDRQYTFKRDFCILCNRNSHLEEEYNLFLTNELIRLFRIQRSSLLNTKIENKSDEEQKEIIDKITEVDTKLNELNKKAELLQEDFEYMLFDRYEGDNAVFVPEVITLEKLKAIQVHILNAFIQSNGRYKITFGIIQPKMEELSLAALISRIEKIFQYYIKSELYSVDYEIKIITYNRRQKEILTEKMKSVKEFFASLQEYALILPILDEIEIIAVELHTMERFQVFKTLRERAKTF